MITSATTHCASPPPPPALDALEIGRHLTDARDRLDTADTLLAVLESWAHALALTPSDPDAVTLDGVAALCSVIRHTLAESQHLLHDL